MSRDGDGPRKGDRARVTYDGVVVQLDDHGRVMAAQVEGEESVVVVPACASVEVLERADDPSQDEVGTVRREEHREDGGQSVWQHVQFQLSATKAGSHWVCTHSDHFGNLGESLTHDQVRDMPVIGAAPGTPAAEAQNVGIGQTLPEGYASWAEYHEKHPYTPPSRLGVRVENTPHGPSPEVRQRIAGHVAEGWIDAAVGAAQLAGMAPETALSYVRSMSEYQTFLSEHGEKREQTRPMTDARRAALRHKQELEAVKQGADHTRRVELAEALHAAQDLPWKDLLVEVRSLVERGGLS